MLHLFELMFQICVCILIVQINFGCDRCSRFFWKMICLVDPYASDSFRFYLNDIVSDYLKMSRSLGNTDQICISGLYSCQFRPCSCKRSERIDQFVHFMKRLTEASTTVDYEEQIYTTVAAICGVCTLLNSCRILFHFKIILGCTIDINATTFFAKRI